MAPCLAVGCIAAAQQTPVSQMETLTRGVVAVHTAEGNFVSWRLLGTDPEGTRFTLLRDGEPIADGLAVTNYADSRGTDGSRYAVVADNETGRADAAGGTPVWAEGFKRIQLDRPATTDGVGYMPHEAAVGDVDADGEYELVVKWLPTDWKDNATAGFSHKTYIDCYRLDGTRLWRIDMGINIRSGSHYTQMAVYDFDLDGRAELICKTAPGTTDGQGRYVSMAADDDGIAGTDNAADYRNAEGRILSGPEFLTVFDGQTGKALHTVWYNPNRAFTTGGAADYSTTWGDDNGNRGDRFLCCVAYLDGPEARPSAVMCRGYYTRAYLWAVDFDGRKLSTKWLHASTSISKVTRTDAQGNAQTRSYTKNTSGLNRNFTAYGQGNHNLSVADVDGDGRDEIVYGAATIDHDGWILYSTGLGHGDAMHLGDLMPDRPGLEVFQVHETEPWGFDVHDAATGELLLHVKGNGDTGRGMAADAFGSTRGHEFWSAASQDVYDTGGNVVSSARPSYCFRTYWDGTLRDNLLDGVKLTDGQGRRLATFSDMGQSTTFGSKATPVVQADLLGDWREELVFFNSADSASLNIFTSTEPTDFAIPTLMHDHTYRMGVAWQNAGYNQPPHLGYYLPDTVATRFVPIGGSPMWQQVALGDSMRAVACRLKNCTGAMLMATYLDGERIKSFSAPDGFAFEVDRDRAAFTLSGMPPKAGTYEFEVRSSGDLSGERLTDTITVVVCGADGVRPAWAAGGGSGPEAVFDLQGRRRPEGAVSCGGIRIVRGAHGAVKVAAGRRRE